MFKNIQKRIEINVRQRKARVHQLVFVGEMVQTILTGYFVRDPLKNDNAVKALCAFFRLYPRLLIRIIKTMISMDSSMKRIILNCCAEVDEIHQSLRRQYLFMKKGGMISNSRWDQVFSPAMQITV